MSTLNGIGTQRFDWRQRPDGSAEATLWFVFVYFSVIPLVREHLQIERIAGEGTPSFFSWQLWRRGKGMYFAYRYELLGHLPLPFFSVLKTYFLAYVVYPIIGLIIPIALSGFLLSFLRSWGTKKEWIDGVMTTFGLGMMVWNGLILAWVLDRSAGRHLSVDAN